MTEKKILVAYFSCSGVTKRVAEKLAAAANADLYEIVPAEPYTNADLNWTDRKSRSTLEMNNPGSRPAIAGKAEDMDSYDAVLVGFPIWWYTAPRIIATFLESYDFSDKTLVAFATSGGSGMGNTDKDLKAYCPNAAEWKGGKRFGSAVDESALKSWISQLGL